MLNNYQILKPISKKQQFGKILLAIRKSDHLKVVLKSAHKSNKLAYERLLNESRYDFNYQGLPKIIDTFEDESGIIVIKKYVEGIAVDQFYKTIKRKSIPSFMHTLTLQLSQLLNYIHSRDIVHCDIKPGNLLIEGDTQSFKLHLIDFGLALNLKNIEDRKMLFPLGYAAPELLLNHLKLVNKKTDYYSVGILIWKLFTDKLPLSHPNPSVFTNLQLTHPLPEHAQIPNKLYTILKKYSHKHTFNLPPNKLESKEVQAHLRSARDKRPNDLSMLINYFENQKSRRFRIW